MEKLIPLFLFYLFTYTPDVFCSVIPEIVASVIFVFSLFFKRMESISLCLLIFILSFSLFSKAYAASFLCFFSFNTSNYVYGKVISEPKRKNGRSIGYTLRIEGIGNPSTLDWVSCGGYIYVVSKGGDEALGDKVLLKGKYNNGYFLSSASFIKERSKLSRGRRKMLSTFICALPRGNVGNITALLLTGSTLDGSTELEESVRSTGLSHLLALSGMHLAILGTIIGKPLNLLLGKKGGKLITTILLFLFVYFSGFRPSLFRAFLFMLLSSFFGIEYGFALSLPVLLILSPRIAVDMGAELSFVALSGILFFAKNGGIIGIVEASIAALATTVPISLRVFGSWTPLSILLSIPGALGIEILFFIIIFQYFIPKSDYIINFIIKNLQKLPTINFIPMQEDLRLYWCILSFCMIKKLFDTLYPLSLYQIGKIRCKYVEPKLR